MADKAIPVSAPKGWTWEIFHSSFGMDSLWLRDAEGVVVAEEDIASALDIRWLSRGVRRAGLRRKREVAALARAEAHMNGQASS